jgi:hypothetical protein
MRRHVAGRIKKAARGPDVMAKLSIQNLNVRIAVINRGDRTVTVTAMCRGPRDACEEAVLNPRRHIAPPADGLWNLDLILNKEVRGDDPVTTREIVFSGEADWCQGVRVHADGVILEHRLADHEITGKRPPRPQLPDPKRMIPWVRASETRSPWLDPDRPPRIIPAGRPVSHRPRRTWKSFSALGA